jgi:hypothetical protein
MRTLIRRLANRKSCSSCRDRVSPFATGCADCGADLRAPSAAVPLGRDRALLWLLGGAIAGGLLMLAVGPLN